MKIKITKEDLQTQIDNYMEKQIKWLVSQRYGDESKPLTGINKIRFFMDLFIFNVKTEIAIKIFHMKVATLKLLKRGESDDNNT